MRKSLLLLGALVLLISLVIGCQSMTQSGVKSSSHQNMNGGGIQVRIKKANGGSTEEIEVEGVGSGVVLDSDVTISVETGSFKIELLDADDEVTLALEARDGETVSGSGDMAVDSFGEATYRVTAVEASNVEYSIDYTFR